MSRVSCLPVGHLLNGNFALVICKKQRTACLFHPASQQTKTDHSWPQSSALDLLTDPCLLR
jgi:hypothetical protein